MERSSPWPAYGLATHRSHGDNAKYRGKIFDVALVTEGIIRKTCSERDIQIIDIAVNVDHVHLFIKYPPKYSVSYIAKKVKEGETVEY